MQSRWINSVFLALFIFLSQTAFGDINNPKSDSYIAIENLSAYVAAQSRDADRLLKSVSYLPDMDLELWRQLTPITKLGVAYISAEEFEPNMGGEKFLALLTRQLAQKYDSVKNNEYLKQHLINSNGKFANVNEIKYAIIPELPSEKLAVIDENVRTTLEAVASQYVSSSSISLHKVLRVHFGLKESEVKRATRTSKTVNDALMAGLAAASIPPTHEERVRSIIAEILQKYDAAKYDPTIKAFVEKHAAKHEMKPDGSPKSTFEPDQPPEALVRLEPPQDWAPPAGGGGGGDGGGGGGGHPKQSHAENYEKFFRSNYSTAESRSFKVASARGGGFGGVVFGNEFQTTGALAKMTPTSSIWIPNNAEAGTLKINVNGTTIVFPTSAEPLRIALDSITAPYSEGDLIGMLGISRLAALTYDTDIPFRVIYHPSIANAKLGNTFALADTLPLAEELMFKAYGVDGAEFLEEKQWCYTWKITDAVTQISVKNSEVKVESKSGFDKSSLLEFQCFYRSQFGENSVSLESFNNLASKRAGLSNTYYALNQTVKALHVVRWLNKFNALPKVFPEIPTHHNPPIINVTRTHINGVWKAEKQWETDEVNQLISAAGFSSYPEDQTLKAELSKVSHLLEKFVKVDNSARERDDAFESLIKLSHRKDQRVLYNFLRQQCFAPATTRIRRCCEENMQPWVNLERGTRINRKLQRRIRSHIDHFQSCIN